MRHAPTFPALLAGSIVLPAVLALTTAEAVEVPVGNPEFGKLVQNSTGTLYYALLDNGDSGIRIDIVLMGDGYTSTEQADFDAVAKEMVEDFLQIEPYKSYACAMNIWVVNLVSPVSGIDNDASALRCVRGDGRKIEGDYNRCLEVCATAGVPGMDAIVVVANDPAHYAAWSPDYGGVTFMTSAIHYGRLMAHELGHVIADLGDEYTCNLCAPGEAPRAFTGTVLEPNLTVLEYLATGQADRTKIPWYDLIASWTDIPTTVGQSCYYSEVGAWEGGGTYATGIWRPQERCIMLYFCGSYGDFCQVCKREIKDRLAAKCTLSSVNGTRYDPPNLPPRPESYIEPAAIELREKFQWTHPLLGGRHIPPCWSCPPEIPTEHVLRVELSGLSASDAAFAVVDEGGAVVATGTRDGSDRMVAEFRALGYRSYMIRFASGQPTGSTLELRTRIFRDGVEQALR